MDCLSDRIEMKRNFFEKGFCMTFQEIISEIPRLTFAERASVIKIYAKSLKTEIKLQEKDYQGASVEEVRGAY